jgi:hypothetical protein
MDLYLRIIVLLLEAVVLISALVAAWLGVMLMFYFEKFTVLNELIDSQYFVGRGNYGDGSKYKMDSWVMGWHTGLACFCLIAAAWLFCTFFSLLSL